VVSLLLSFGTGRSRVDRSRAGCPVTGGRGGGVKVNRMPGTVNIPARPGGAH
jgi:hypothetical protein